MNMEVIAQDDDKRIPSPGRRDAPLFSWPWENFGNYKVAILAKYWTTEVETNDKNWCFHILLLCYLRSTFHQLWSTFNNMLFLNGKHRISLDGIDYDQIDAELHWDNFIILQAVVAIFAYWSMPSISNLPLWDGRGLICCFALSILRCQSPYIIGHIHCYIALLSLKISIGCTTTKVLHPYAGGHAAFLEHLILSVVIGVPILGTAPIGYGSISLVYCYVLVFDFLRCLGHSNVEVITHHLLKTIPFLKYLISSPQKFSVSEYHFPSEFSLYNSIHHKDMRTNFCLFMPVYDMLGKTMNSSSWDLHIEITTRTIFLTFCCRWHKQSH